jgi:serine/threonine protein kinase
VSETDPKTVDAVCEQTLRLSKDEREVFLRETCGDDTALIQAVTVQLERSADQLTTQIDEDSQSDTALVDIKPGDRIGPYRVMTELGVGGMGLVFLAKQREPIRREVALKVIKLGMDTREVIARFESERQALALMSHPNVAAVLDAGSTATGRPYFVMEYVKGIPMTEYCDNHRLDIDQRLNLFLQACEGIQHAHQKGIIHRDIKPGNTMVTQVAGKPTAKIIDFGIAKSTDQKLVESTFFTRFGVFVGTPNYMSPEQAGSNPLDIDTRTDVYSLGVLLYQLLTGTVPFETGSFDGKSFDEIQRIIREVDPPKPADRLRGDSPRLRKVAKRRQSDPKTLRRALLGELSWIVMRAMAKDRHHRYASVQALAEDINRYRNDQPVHAGPISPLYQARKFVLRHKLLVGSASVVAIALLGGLLVSSWALLEARQSRTQAETRAAVTRATNALLYELFVPESSQAAGASSGRSLDESITLMLGRLDNSTAFSGPRFEGLDDEKTLTEVALAVRSLVADRESLLGNYEAAATQYQQAEVLLLKIDDNNSSAWFDLRTRQIRNLARLRPAEAGSQLKALIEKATSLHSDTHPDVLRAQLALADVHIEQSRHQAALTVLAAARGQLSNSDNPETLLQSRLATATAIAAQNLGRYPEALEAASLALDLDQALFGERSLQVSEASLRLARICALMGNLERAATRYRLALEINLEYFGYAASGSARIQSELATVLTGMGQIEEAELELFTLIRNLQELQTRNADSQREVRLIEYTLQLASSYFLGRRWSDARSWAEQALERARAYVETPHPQGADELPLLNALVQLGQLDLAGGQTATARVLLLEARDLSTMEKAPRRSAIELALARAEILAARRAQAEIHLAAAMDDSSQRGPALLLFAHAALLEGDSETAVAFFDHARNELSQSPAPLAAAQTRILNGLLALYQSEPKPAGEEIEAGLAELRQPGPHPGEQWRIEQLAISLRLVIIHLENKQQLENADQYRIELANLSDPGR